MTALKTTFAHLLNRLPVAGARPWKIALFVGVFLLPGGTLGVLALAWFEHRRARRRTLALPATPTVSLLPTVQHDDLALDEASGPMSMCQDCPA